MTTKDYTSGTEVAADYGGESWERLAGGYVPISVNDTTTIDTNMFPTTDNNFNGVIETSEVTLNENTANHTHTIKNSGDPEDEIHTHTFVEMTPEYNPDDFRKSPFSDLGQKEVWTSDSGYSYMATYAKPSGNISYTSAYHTHELTSDEFIGEAQPHLHYIYTNYVKLFFWMRTDETIQNQNTDVYKDFSDIVRRTINLIYRKGSIVFSYKQNNKYSKDYTWYNIDDGWLLGHLTAGGTIGNNNRTSLEQTEGFTLENEYIPNHTHKWIMVSDYTNQTHTHFYTTGYHRDPNNKVAGTGTNFSLNVYLDFYAESDTANDDAICDTANDDTESCNNQQHLDNILPAIGNSTPHSHDFEIPTIGMYMYSRLDNYNDDKDIYNNIYETIDELYPLGAVIISKCPISFLQTTNARKYWTRITITQDSLIISADLNSSFEVGMEINNKEDATCSFTKTSETTLTEKNLPTHTHKTTTSSYAPFNHTHDGFTSAYFTSKDFENYENLVYYRASVDYDNDNSVNYGWKVGGEAYGKSYLVSSSHLKDCNNCSHVDNIEDDDHKVYTNEQPNAAHTHSGKTDEWETKAHAHNLNIPVISVYIYIHHIKIH